MDRRLVFMLLFSASLSGSCRNFYKTKSSVDISPSEKLSRHAKRYRKGNPLGRTSRREQSSFYRRRQAANHLSTGRYSHLSGAERDQVVALAIATALTEKRQSRMATEPNSAALSVLTKAGAELKDGQLNFRNFDFNHRLSREEKAALQTLFPESAAMIPDIDDPDRRNTVIIGSWMVLPKERLRANGRFRALTTDDYRRELDYKRDEFLRAMQTYMEKDNVADSSVSRFFNRRRSNDAAARAASNLVSRLISELVYDYGVLEEEGQQMRDAFATTISGSDENIAEGMHNMYVSVGVAAALMAISAPAAIVLWPYAASIGTFLTTTAPGVAALSSGAISLAGTRSGEAAVDSGISAYQGQGSLICNLGKHAFEDGPTGIASALAAAGFGVAVGAAANGLVQTARVAGFSEGALRGVAKAVTLASPIPALFGANRSHREADTYRALRQTRTRFGGRRDGPAV